MAPLKIVLKILKRLIWLILSLSTLTLVISKVPAPASWPQASVWQILAIFLPLTITFTLFFHLFLKNLTFSFIFALASVVLTVLQALRNLTTVTFLLTILVTAVIVTIIRKLKLGKQVSKFRLRNLLPNK